MFVFGLMCLPFLDLNVVDERAAIDASVVSGLDNPNAVASWFGFCAIAFTIRGLEERRSGFRRYLSWVIALFSLFIVGLTVSRGILASVAVATVLIFRKELKRSFIPIFGLMTFSAVAFAFGMFDIGIARYADRGMVETGRFIVWPVVLGRIAESPIIGIGVSNILSTAASLDRAITPHNAVLFIALSSGIVPLFFYGAFWSMGFRGARIRLSYEHPDSPYVLPLLVYCFLIDLSTNMAFNMSWATLALCASWNHIDLVKKEQIARFRLTGLLGAKERRRFVGFAGNSLQAGRPR